MLFPDEANLRLVAAALWENPDNLSQASVIVGAGFSKNAKSKSNVSSSSTLFPSWAELTNVMVDELYAHETDENRKWRKTNASGAVSNALRIADEYEAARGRGQLDSLLKRAIPDLDFEPGELHVALCELPWVDILTTNYDTLLERAARSQLERRYQSVLSQQDIPTTQQPRIIKLHGSFPESRQPFIITEEDFRTYESKFPAMVNLAQQCLAEKTCCLIGFSGDDPNFLRWTGWVRDVLGQSHMQPVYLVGLHDHSPSQKSLLDKRHIRTIDLSPLFPKKKWPDIAQRHEVATTWFIEALKSLKPAETFQWPEVATRSFTNLKLPNDHPALPLNNTVQFKPEFSRPSSVKLPDDIINQEIVDANKLSTTEEMKFQKDNRHHKNKKNREEELDYRISVTVESWEVNRSIYPGWLIPPWSNHRNLIKNTESWVSPISERAAKQKDKQKALKWLFELSWRLERAISPWTREMITCVAQLVDLGTKESDTEKVEIELAIQLLRAFREDGQEQEFFALVEKLKALSNLPDYANDFICQQTVLLHLENWRIKDAMATLLQWDTVASDALWKAKRAALLGEFRPDLARENALSALSSLQDSPALSDIKVRSREAYVLWLTTVLTDWDDPQRQDFVSRRRALQRKSFDAFNFEERVSETLRAQPKTNVSQQELLAELTPGQSQVTRAYTMRRYIEDTAGLISGPGFTVYAKNIKNTVPWMALSDPEEAIRLSVRYRSSNVKDRTFPTYMLATLGRKCIAAQFDGLLNTISFLIAEPTPEGRFKSANDPVNPEQLLDSSNKNAILHAAVLHGIHLQPVLTEDQRNVFAELLLKLRSAASGFFQWQTINQIDEAIEVVFDSLSPERLGRLAPELVLQPLSGYDGFPQNPLRQRDVIVSVSFRSEYEPVTVDQEKRSELDLAIDNLLQIHRRNSTFDTKWNAVMRLSFAARQKLLTADQLREFQDVLEVHLQEIRADITSAMNSDAFHPADLLTLTVGDKDALRELVLNIISDTPWPSFLQKDGLGKITSVRHLGSFKDPSSLAVELTTAPWVNRDFGFQPSDWSEDKVLKYLANAKAWIEEEGTALVKRENQDVSNIPWSSKGELTWRFDRISKFCNNVAFLGHYENKKLLARAVKLSMRINELLPHFGVKYGPILILSGKIDAASMTLRIRELYSGNDTNDKFSALMSVLLWAASSSRVGIDPPPADLVSEFAVMIRTRRSPDLGWALDIAQIIVKRFANLTEQSFYDDILIGLSYLAVETNPKAPITSVLNQNASFTDLRVSAIKLLNELPKTQARDQVIEHWINQIEDEVDWRVREALEHLSADSL